MSDIRPEDEVIDVIGELVDWQLADSDAAQNEHGRVTFGPPRHYVLAITDSAGRILAGLEVTDDGRLVAEYDPADLDDAARGLFDFLASYANANGLISSAAEPR